MIRLAKLTTFLMLFLFSVSIPFDSANATIRKKHKQRRDKIYKQKTYTRNPWSFQFAIDGRADRPGEDQFSGARLSLAYDIDRYTAVRVSIGGFTKGNGFDNGRWIDSDRFLFTPFNSRTFDVDGGYISMQYLFYPSRNRKLDFFFGIGPRLSAEEGDPGTLAIRRNSGLFQTVELIDTDRAILFGAGVETTAGLEWYIGRKLSLIGEYGFVVQNQWYQVDVDYIDNFGHTWTEQETFSDGLHFDRSHVKLGLALHF